MVSPVTIPIISKNAARKEQIVLEGGNGMSHSSLRQRFRFNPNHRQRLPFSLNKER